LFQARTQGAEDLRTQLAIKAARAAESRAWAAWQDSLTKSERAQAAADGARLRGEVADLKAAQAAKQAAATAWDNARRATYRAEVAARTRFGVVRFVSVDGCGGGGGGGNLWTFDTGLDRWSDPVRVWRVVVVFVLVLL
jgi:hypothetical protein